MITFHVPGPPVPWMRAASKGNRRFTPPEMRRYKANIINAFCIAREGVYWNYKADAYALTVEVTPVDGRCGDWDNYGKVVSDALNKWAYDDDRLIKRGLVTVHAPSKTAPGLKVTIEVINAGGEHG